MDLGLTNPFHWEVADGSIVFSGIVQEWVW